MTFSENCDILNNMIDVLQFPRYLFGASVHGALVQPLLNLCVSSKYSLLNQEFAKFIPINQFLVSLFQGWSR